MQYRINTGSIHEQFLASRAKIQVFGGGFGNGKTACASVKLIQLARDYPGLNALVARSTYPRLNDTVRKELFKWLPQQWIKSFTKSDNTLTLLNGSVINFRHVQQSGKGPASSSNLLSATYDIILIDQLEDPEIKSKDFSDLLGRLRGSTVYTGTDPTMPLSGPRWILVTLNPTRGWFFREFVRYVLEYQKSGRIPDQLGQMLGTFGAERVEEFIHLVQGSTMENAHNLGDDYIRTLQATYSGVMADRYIRGDWGAFQGLVYPMYDFDTHMVPESKVRQWKFGASLIQWVECFDFGIRAPSAYLLGFRDTGNNLVFVDGLYERELSPEETVARIKSIRAHWGVPVDTTKPIYADPSTFRRTGGDYRTIGKSVAGVFLDGGLGVHFTRGNNDIESGVTKVRGYLTPHRGHASPFTDRSPAPFVYFNRDRLQFLDDEITDYYFEEPDDPNSTEDKPQDGTDHAMDALKYGLTDMPLLKTILPAVKTDYSHLTKWREAPDGWNDHGGTGPRYSHHA